MAAEVEQPPAQVALAWGDVHARRGQASQFVANLVALGVELSPQHAARLDAASALRAIHPYQYFGPPFTGMVNGAAVRGWHG